jgi:cysteine desulfurase
MTVDCRALNVDLLTMASHKMGAPKNAGVLFIRDGVVVQPILHGASQEHGRRAGTENVIMIVGLGAACALATQHLSRTYRHMQRLRDRLYERIVAALTQRLGDAASQLIRVNGHLSSRLPNTLSIGFRGCTASNLIKRLSSRVACSAGAACHSKVGHDQTGSTTTVTVSHVLKAMRVPLEFAAGTLRFSVGKMTDENEIDTAAELIADAVCAELQ